MCSNHIKQRHTIGNQRTKQQVYMEQKQQQKETVILELQLEPKNSKMSTCMIWYLVGGMILNFQLKLRGMSSKVPMLQWHLLSNTSGNLHKRTIPEIAEHLKMLEFAICHTFLPATVGDTFPMMRVICEKKY